MFTVELYARIRRAVMVEGLSRREAAKWFEIFDIVAVTVQEAAPEFHEIPNTQMALHLRMLRHAIERSPTELQRILDEVLKLPKRKQQELARLLDETNLSGIISAATIVADRLKFLTALQYVLFDYDAKQKLKERSQLHKILEQNTWIFGEEYNLWASDKGLTTVLKAHKKKLDPNLVIDEPVKVIDKKRGVRPGEPEFISEEGKRLFNRWRPTKVNRLAGDAAPFVAFLTQLIPNEFERNEVWRWLATLIARPQTRMKYSLLLFSEMQGVGKDTLAMIARVLVGKSHTSNPILTGGHSTRRENCLFFPNITGENRE
jgi:hypothetical protein